MIRLGAIGDVRLGSDCDAAPRTQVGTIALRVSATTVPVVCAFGGSGNLGFAALRPEDLYSTLVAVGFDASYAAQVQHSAFDWCPPVATCDALNASDNPTAPERDLWRVIGPQGAAARIYQAGYRADAGFCVPVVEQHYARLVQGRAARARAVAFWQQVQAAIDASNAQ